MIDFGYLKRKYTLKKLKKFPRYTPLTVKIDGLEITTPDAASLRSTYQSIFIKEIYKFKSSTSSPLIIDCGAHIGLSIIYFKKQYPGSRIIGFEADPDIFSYLEKNLITNDSMGNVRLYNSAVWTSEGEFPFYQEGADGGRILNEEKCHLTQPSMKTVKVPSVRLKDFLNEPVEFLKMDIEGAETEVLPDIEEKLHLVKNIFIEYHSFVHREQKLPEILGILKKSGFRLHIIPEIYSQSPLFEINEHNGMDLQLNLYGVKRDT